MFMEIVNAMPGPAVNAADFVLTGQRPLQLADYLESYWNVAVPMIPLAGGLPAMARPVALDPPSPQLPAPAMVGWPHHIAYALCLENSRLFEIMRRVVFEARAGERLPAISATTQRWLQASEELFLGASMPFSVRSLTSALRPDASATRRNAYYRLLGMDLNHGTDDGRPYPYIKAEAANREFPLVFETLLREVWKGYVNRNTMFNTNTTDNNAIVELVRRLREMLNARRTDGNLAREEFDAVATLSWFYLTIAYPTSVAGNLLAAVPGGGVADRLRMIGNLVGLAPHARADSYFQLATPLSTVLRAIELGIVGGPANLYSALGAYTPWMLQIITHWSIVTGRNLKEESSATLSTSVLQTTAPGASTAVARPASNGSRISQVLR